MIAETFPELEEERSGNGRGKILLVDDDETQLEMLRYGLERQGFDVIAATRGNQLIEYTAEEKPDVIVLDVHLPDANGLEICQKLSDQPATSNIPVVILSGSTDHAIVQQARAAGCRFFLSKPFDPNAILLVIRQALEGVGF